MFSTEHAWQVETIHKHQRYDCVVQVTVAGPHRCADTVVGVWSGRSCRAWLGRCCPTVQAADDLRFYNSSGRQAAGIYVSVLGPMFVIWLSRPECLWFVILIATSVAECQAGIDYGFTSVMIDGLVLGEYRPDLCCRGYCYPHSISVEAEIGFVGYDNGTVSHPTKPDEAAELVNMLA